MPKSGVERERTAVFTRERIKLSRSAPTVLLRAATHAPAARLLQAGDWNLTASLYFLWVQTVKRHADWSDQKILLHHDLP